MAPTVSWCHQVMWPVLPKGNPPGKEETMVPLISKLTRVLIFLPLQPKPHYHSSIFLLVVRFGGKAITQLLRLLYKHKMPN